MTPTDAARLADACEQAALAEDECAVSYGYFHGGDPRNFDPDPECSTEAERAAHKAACEAWERGERPAIPVPHTATPERARAELAAGTVDSAIIGPGGAIVHPTNFGLGTNTDPSPIAADLRAAAAHFRALASSPASAICGWHNEFERADQRIDGEPVDEPKRCTRPARWRSCKPTIDTPTCDEHKCRCAKPLASSPADSAEDAAGVAGELEAMADALGSYGMLARAGNRHERLRVAARLLRQSSAAVAEAVRVERERCVHLIDRIDLSSRVPGEHLSGMREGIALAIECIRARSARADGGEGKG